MKISGYLITVICFVAVRVYPASTGYGSSSLKQELTLRQIFDLADINSKSIRLKKLAIDEATQGINVAKSDKLPSVNAEMSLSYIGDGVMTDRNFSNALHADMPHFGNSFVLKASQTIYSGGAMSRRIDNARLLKRKAEAEYVINRQDIRFILVGYFLDLYQLHNQKTVYEKNIGQTEHLLKDIKASYRQGTALRSDITRYELQLQNLELELTALNNHIDILSHKLATIIGLESDIMIKPDTTGMAGLTTEFKSETMWNEHIGNAPDVVLADIRVSQEKNSLQLIRSTLRPHVNVFAATDFTGPILIEVPPLNNNFGYWHAGVGISYNIDALYKSKKKIRQAHSAILRQEESRLLKEEETENNIHEAYVKMNEARVRLRTQRKSVQLARENFNIVRQRYINGLSLITDMLDASNTLLDMEIRLENYKADILYRYYQLEKLTGRL